MPEWGRRSDREDVNGRLRPRSENKSLWDILVLTRRLPAPAQEHRLAPRAIINICSVAGKQAWSGSGTYSASKFGVLALTQALADEGKEHDIKAAAVCPAMVATPMTGVSGPDYLQPEDCAETVLYLLRLSPAAWPTEIVLERKGAGYTPARCVMTLLPNPGRILFRQQSGRDATAIRLGGQSH